MQISTAEAPDEAVPELLVRETASRPVRVLVEDRELAQCVGEERRMLAERACVAGAVVLQRGRWTAAPYAQEASAGFGLLVVKGLISGRVGRRGGYGAELLGPGDLLRPLQRPSARASVPFDSNWSVIHPARVAVLGPQFVERAAPYPELAGVLIGRALLRTRRLAVIMAIVHYPRVDTRVHLLFWHLAARWGHLTPDGTLLPLPITHALLAEMIGSRRPTVTKALAQLAEQGLVTQLRSGWLLTGTAPADLDQFSPSD
ncbi:MAG: helix-turn-helix domain-containing protein [Solirubrobacteraceae bacterium]